MICAFSSSAAEAAAVVDVVDAAEVLLVLLLERVAIAIDMLRNNFV